LARAGLEFIPGEKMNDWQLVILVWAAAFTVSNMILFASNQNSSPRGENLPGWLGSVNGTLDYEPIGGNMKYLIAGAVGSVISAGLYWLFRNYNMGRSRR